MPVYIFRAFVQIDIDLHFVGNKPHLGFIFIFICYLGILTSLDCLDISKYLWSLLYGNRCCFLYYITRVNTAPYFSEVSHKYYIALYPHIYFCKIKYHPSAKCVIDCNIAIFLRSVCLRRVFFSS